MLVKIILVIIVLHLIAGFGWMVYKLTPRKGEEIIDSSQDELNKKEK
jgi:hypothetical protein